MSYANLIKIALHHRHFSKKLTTNSKQQYRKIHLNGCFIAQLFFENVPEWLLLKGTCEDLFILKVRFLALRHVKKE